MVDKEMCEVNHKNINEKIDRLEVKHKEDCTRLESRLNKVENTYEVIAKLTFEVSQMRIEMNALIPRVNDLEDKPAKKWEELMKYVLFTIIGGIIYYLLTQIGLQ
jgi:predicted nuclease with TOPRIM domain